MSGDGGAAQAVAEANNPPPSTGVVVEGHGSVGDQGGSDDGKMEAMSQGQKQTSRPWSREEDQMIIDHVTQHGTKSWSQLAGMIPGRTGKQMRERWHNQLDPHIKKDPWTPEEDAKLLQLYQDFGSRWAEISKRFPGRTDNSIKNRWYGNVRKGSRTLERQDGSFSEGPLYSPGTKDPAVGSKRSADGGGGGSAKRAANGSHVTQATVMISNTQEALAACGKVLQDLIVTQIGRAAGAVAQQHGEVDTSGVVAELNAIRIRVETGAIKGPFEAHQEVVQLWRKSLETESASPSYALHLVLSQIFDEQFFKHIYQPISHAIKQDRVVQQGVRVRVYNAPEHRWWVGSVSEYDAKANTWLVSQDSDGTGDEILQVWVAIPSFYAQVITQEGIVLHWPTGMFNGGMPGAAASGANKRGGYKGLQVNVGAEGVSDLKDTLGSVQLSALFPNYTGTETALQALEAYVERASTSTSEWPAGSV